MQQVALLGNVASGESLLSLIENGAQLQENISAVKDMISLKREKAERLSKPQQFEYAQVTKLDELHCQISVQNMQDSSPNEGDLHYTQGQRGRSPSHVFCQADELREDLSDHDDFIKDLQDFKNLAKRTEDWLKTLQWSHDTQETDTQKIPAKTQERLQELQVKNDA